jgi:hypothetical protein
MEHDVCWQATQAVRRRGRSLAEEVMGHGFQWKAEVVAEELMWRADMPKDLEAQEGAHCQKGEE